MQVYIPDVGYYRVYIYIYIYIYMYSANITRTNILYVSDVCLQAYTIEYVVFECRLIMYI